MSWSNGGGSGGGPGKAKGVGHRRVSVGTLEAGVANGLPIAAIVQATREDGEEEKPIGTSPAAAGQATLMRKYNVAEIAMLFGVFMLSGPMLIMSNKYILRDLGFRFPLTLTLITLMFCWFSCWLYVTVTKAELKNAHRVNRGFFMSRICPIGALSAGTIVLGMASYLFLTVAFVQMLKAFTPVMTLGGLVLFGLEKPTPKIVLSVFAISFGTAIAGYGELNFNLFGIACMLCAQTFEAMKLIFTQVVLQNFKFDLVETLYYITPTSALFVFLFAIVIEFPKMTAADVDLMYSNKHAFLVSCIFAVLTNVINTFVIQFSNALVLKILVTARNALLVLFNAVVMAELVAPVQFFGYSISLAAFLVYNYLKFTKK